jgi:hypothetical protein
MARYSGVVGYGVSQEDPPDSGVWVDSIVERPYFGDITRKTRGLESGNQANPDITVGNSISIVADEYATEHFLNIRYLSWAGALWTVTNVEARRPRLLLDIGEVYNGPTPEPAVP